MGPVRPVSTAWYLPCQLPAIDARSGSLPFISIDWTAPPQLMSLASGRWAALWSPFGTVRVRPLGPPKTLGSLPAQSVRPSIRAALIEQAREEHFSAWLTVAQKSAFPEAICWRDQFPELGEVDLTNYLPFLALTQ